MLKQTILGGILALAACPPVPVDQPTGEPQVVIHDAEILPCPRTVYSAWDDIPGCDLNGSQTWIWVDEQTDLEWVGNLASYCHDAGGIYAYNNYDPATHYCINIDY